MRPYYVALPALFMVTLLVLVASACGNATPVPVSRPAASASPVPATAPTSTPAPRAVSPTSAPAVAPAPPNRLAMLQKSTRFAAVVSGASGLRDAVIGGGGASDSISTPFGYGESQVLYSTGARRLENMPYLQSMPAITWSGTTFSFKDAVRQGEFGHTQDLTGTVSADGQTLLSATYTYWRLGGGGSDNVRDLVTARMVLSNVPLGESGGSAINGPDVQKYVTSIEYKSKYTNPRDPSKNSEKTYVSGDWSAPKTRLFVTFSGYP